MEVWSIVSLPISVDLVELEIVKAIESNKSLSAENCRWGKEIWNYPGEMDENLLPY